VCIPECSSKQRAACRSAAADCPVTYKAKGVQRAEISRCCITTAIFVCVCVLSFASTFAAWEQIHHVCSRRVLCAGGIRIQSRFPQTRLPPPPPLLLRNTVFSTPRKRILFVALVNRALADKLVTFRGWWVDLKCFLCVSVRWHALIVNCVDQMR
jgi:hypothetical protein